jgi:Stress responsive A/B Barrel Domain
MADEVVRHVVTWRWKEGTAQEAIDAVLDGVMAFAALPGVVSVRRGTNRSVRANGFTHFLEVDVESWDALTTYRKHPVHVETAQRLIWPIAEDTVVLDYEVSR